MRPPWVSVTRVMRSPLEACSASGDGVSYEQAVTLSGEGGDRRLYYVAEVTPLFISDKLTGYVCIFKDITALKNSLQQLENSRTRMMEQERQGMKMPFAGSSS